ncbi:MAG: class I SAM-dependent methyltransferase [Flavobacteriales bacterium]|nr:class I SAM-dependent methyltransferase [Flavobacteriales bacterium]
MQSRSTNFYNRISFFYPIIDSFLKQHKKRLVDEVNAQPVGSLLELGVGQGNYLIHYKHQDITAIDTSLSMLEQAKKVNSKKIELLKMNAEFLSFNDHQFDYVIAAHLLSISKDPNQIIREAIRVLKPNGKLIILNHFTENSFLGKIEILFQPIAKLFHFNSFFQQENLTELNTLKCLKALKFGLLNNYRLLVFEK